MPTNALCRDGAAQMPIVNSLTMAAAPFPYPDHRSTEEVAQDDVFGCDCELPDALDHRDDCPIVAAECAA